MNELEKKLGFGWWIICLLFFWPGILYIIYENNNRKNRNLSRELNNNQSLERTNK